MIVCGCDLGSATGKVVLMEDGHILSSAVVRATSSPEKTALAAVGQALEAAGIPSIDSATYVVATGYGRRRVPFRNDDISEISCHAKGTHWLCPQVRTVVDVGGQDSKVISLDEHGKVMEFAMNDKCAAGTGRFFEAMARGLDCGLEELARLSLTSDTPATITKQCSVFAETEVVTLINDGISPQDIAAGVHASIAARLYGMVSRVGLVPQVALTGGCGQNQGLIRALEKRLGYKIALLPCNPQITGALGAALFAGERAARQEGTASPLGGDRENAVLSPRQATIAQAGGSSHGCSTCPDQSR